MTVPSHFCWTRFGTEAGEPIEEILERKERERRANDGIFLWGIGNAIGPSINALLSLDRSPMALFSPILSQPRDEDVHPSKVVRWSSGVNLDGSIHPLPKGSLVTSRAPSSGRSRYALVCYSSKTLQLSLDSARLSIHELLNLRSGKPVGSSQVTAVVRRVEQTNAVRDASYPVAMSVGLTAPYLVKLADPIPYEAA